MACVQCVCDLVSSDGSYFFYMFTSNNTIGDMPPK